MRVAEITGAPFRSALLKIYTNQGIVGLGEVRDGASATYALMLQEPAAGREPLRHRPAVPPHQAVRRPWPPGRRCLGCRDRALGYRGQGLGVPIYQMLGGKFRDKVRC